MSTGLGTLAPIEVGEFMGIRPSWADSTSVGGSTWEFMLEHAYAAIATGLGRRRGTGLRVDRARRPEEAAPQRQPELRHARPGAVRRAVRAHAHRQVRHGRPPPHARVRHDHRAAGRDRGVDPPQRVAQPRRLPPRPDHDRRRARLEDDRRSRSPSCTAASAPTAAGPSSSPARSAPATAPRPRCGCSARARRSRTRP